MKDTEVKRLLYQDSEGFKEGVEIGKKEMIEGLVEEESERKLSDESWRYKNIFDHSQYPQSFECPDGYIFKDENGNVINVQKIVLEKKKKEYPETYEECAEVIAELTGSDCNPKGCMGYMSTQLTALQKLLICRNAYWEIAGEEMGLGKPWEPDWKNLEQEKHCIWVDVGDITSRDVLRCQHVLSFPTPEMRDAFKENFDPDIEICKELLQ